MRSFRKWMQRSALARNTFWMFLGQGLRLILQGGAFVLIARSLGADGYGAFVGAVSLVAIVAPFSTMGFGNLLIKNVSRDPELFPQYWGNTLLMTGASGAVLLGFVLVLARLLLPVSIPVTLVLLVAFSDLLAARFTDVAALAFQGLEQMKWTAKINVLLSLIRLAAAGLAVGLWRHPTASQWSAFYCGSSAIAAIAAVAIVTVRLGRPRLAVRRILPELVEGFHFSAGTSAQTIYNDIDKAMLSRFSDLGATGIYAAAYRLIDVAFVPIRSLLFAASPGCFRAGGNGVNASVAYMRRLLPKGAAYSGLIFVTLIVGAPLIPKILGPEYARTVDATRWLAILPALRTIQLCFSDALSGAGYQGLRMTIQAAVAGFNVLINLWLIPAYSWRGAVYSSLASDLLLLVAVICAATMLCSRENKNATVAAVTYP
jgi:O-antigen/teichoic acid export membrane protein